MLQVTPWGWSTTSCTRMKPGRTLLSVSRDSTSPKTTFLSGFSVCLLYTKGKHQKNTNIVDIGQQNTNLRCSPIQIDRILLCLKLIYEYWYIKYISNTIHRLVEWIELLTALGADQIFLYQLDVHPNITKVHVHLYDIKVLHLCLYISQFCH